MSQEMATLDDNPDLLEDLVVRLLRHQQLALPRSCPKDVAVDTSYEKEAPLQGRFEYQSHDQNPLNHRQQPPSGSRPEKTTQGWLGRTNLQGLHC